MAPNSEATARVSSTDTTPLLSKSITRNATGDGRGKYTHIQTHTHATQYTVKRQTVSTQNHHATTTHDFEMQHTHNIRLSFSSGVPRQVTESARRKQVKSILQFPSAPTARNSASTTSGEVNEGKALGDMSEGDINRRNGHNTPALTHT